MTTDKLPQKPVLLYTEETDPNKNKDRSIYVAEVDGKVPYILNAISKEPNFQGNYSKIPRSWLDDFRMVKVDILAQSKFPSIYITRNGVRTEESDFYITSKVPLSQGERLEYTLLKPFDPIKDSYDPSNPNEAVLLGSEVQEHLENKKKKPKSIDQTTEGYQMLLL